MKLIVGLGNPGSKYDGTRHNIGAAAVGVLRERLSIDDFRNESKFKSEIARGEFNREKIIIIRPQTFMNLSGEAVRLVKQYYKIGNDDVWVVYDDIDLPLGVLRIREEGSAGTHNGMKSVIQCLSTESFSRFRLGIETRGEISPGRQDLSSFVLESFRNEELPEVNRLIDTFAESAVLAIKKDVETAKQEFSA